MGDLDADHATDPSHTMVMRTQRGGPAALYEARCTGVACRWKSHVAFTPEAESMALIRKRWAEHQADLARKRARAQQIAELDAATGGQITRNANILIVLFCVGIVAALVWGLTAVFGGGDDGGGGAVVYDETECSALSGFMRRDDITVSEKADAIDEYQANC